MGQLKRLDILVVNYEYPPIGGGGGFVTRDIAEKLAENGHRVTVLTSGFKDLAEYEKKGGVEIFRVPVIYRNDKDKATLLSMLSYVLSGYLFFIKKLRKKHFDIINTHFAIPSGPLGYALSRKLNIPNVLSIHGGDIYDPSKALSPHRIKLLSMVVQKMINAAHRVVAQSKDTRQKAQQYHGAIRHIHIIPLGIKRPRFFPVDRIALDLGKNDLVLCTIGRLVKRKNIEATLLILSSLKKRFCFKFIVIGNGPEYERIAEKVGELGLAAHVVMCGRVSEKRKIQYLENADIYISTALHEGFGLVFLEAMACGLPIVSFNHGGQNDFLQDGKSGFMVNLNDTQLFSSRLSQLMEEPGLRRKMGEFNRRLVQPYYIEACAQEYERLFYSTIRDQGGEGI